MKIVMLAILTVSMNGFAVEENCEVVPPPEIGDLNDVIRCENLDRGLDKEGNKELYKLMVRNKAAMDNCDETKIKKGEVVYPKTSTHYFENTKIDCKKEYDNLKFSLARASLLLSSNKSDLKSLETEVPSVDEKNQDLKNKFKKYQDACASGNEQNCLNAKGELIRQTLYYKQTAIQAQKMKTFSDTRALFDSVSKDLCFNHIEKKKHDNATMSDCSAELESFELPSPELDCKGKAVKGHEALISMEKTIRSSLSCKERLAKIKSLFASRVNNLDDLMAMKYLAKNFKSLLKEPKKRAIIGASLHAAVPVPLGAAEDVALPFRELDEVSEQQNFNSSAIDLRLAGISIQNKAFKKYGLDKYANFCQSSSKEKILDDVLEDYAALIKSPEKIRAEGTEFGNKCDKKIASIFGDENTVASACGHDHVGKGAGQDRSHNFMNAHFYPNKKGAGEGPLYAPKGMTSMKLIPGMASQGCYKLLYAKGIGDLKGSYTIDFCHTGKPATGRNIASLPKNDRGSSLIGNLGGVGGYSAAEDYNHSHLQLRTGAGRVNFVDAFCRNTEE